MLVLCMWKLRLFITILMPVGCPTAVCGLCAWAGQCVCMASVI
jgi:hypothetical protein